MKRILIVEDSETDAMVIERQLSLLDPPAVIHRARALAEVLRLLGASEYQAIVLDLTLPDSAGIETYRACRRATRAAILVQTGSDDAEVRRAVAHNGDIFTLKTRFDELTLIDDLQAALLKREGVLLAGKANG